MNTLRNTQGINQIIMKPTAYTKCVIGGDWYKNELEIEFCPDQCYPDYIQVNEWIMKNIDGKIMNIEDVVDEVYKMLKENYHPTFLKVTDYITDCRTHFDVIVSK